MIIVVYIVSSPERTPTVLGGGIGGDVGFGWAWKEEEEEGEEDEGIYGFMSFEYEEDGVSRF